MCSIAIINSMISSSSFLVKFAVGKTFNVSSCRTFCRSQNSVNSSTPLIWFSFKFCTVITKAFNKVLHNKFLLAWRQSVVTGTRSVPVWRYGKSTQIFPKYERGS